MIHRVNRDKLKIDSSPQERVNLLSIDRLATRGLVIYWRRESVELSEERKQLGVSSARQLNKTLRRIIYTGHEIALIRLLVIGREHYVFRTASSTSSFRDLSRTHARKRYTRLS